MIGIIVATHGGFGSALLSTVRMILGESPALVSVTLEVEDSMETFRDKLEMALLAVDPKGTGALILTDMLGGTPFNVAISMATQRNLQVLTGVNLPMLLKAVSHREGKDFSRLCGDIRDAARESIVTSVDLMKTPK